MRQRAFVTGIVLMALLLVPLALFGAHGQAAAPQLTFWHYWTDRNELLTDLAKEYYEKTGVRVKVELYPGDGYSNKLQAAAQAGTLPDVIGWTGGGGESLSRYVKAGWIQDISDEIDAGWGKWFFPDYIEQFSYAPGNAWDVKPGIYGVPLDVNNMQIMYSKTLFRKAGLDPERPPKTWEEFLAVGKKLAAKGIIPFAPGFGSWAHLSWLDIYQHHIVGTDRLIQTFQGKLPYAGVPEWRQVFGLFAQMRDAGILARGITSITVPDSERLFATGQAAMIFDGSWAIGVLNVLNPKFDDYGVFMPPTVAGAAHPLRIPGGIGAALVANARSPYAKQAVDFIRWMTAPEQQARYAQSSFNLPANRNVVGAQKLSPQLAQFTDDMGKVIPVLPIYERPNVQDAISKVIQSILIGEKTVDEAIKDVQAAKDASR